MIRSLVRSPGGAAYKLAKQRGQVYSMPAPVGGWNAREGLALMKETDAVILDNWFPRASDVKVRNGYSLHASGLGAAIDSLMSWNGPVSSKLFAATSTKIYNVTAAGAVGAADISSLTSGRWQHVNFGTSAGAFLYLVNGVDDPRYYNGTSWTTPTITGSGLTPANLIHVNVFKKALFFIEENKLGFWYFPVNTISGAISYFDVSPYCRLGGYMMAMGTWTRDGGSGLDDIAVFITSMGEVLVYQGTDPGTANAWALVGQFNIGAPIGRRCMTKVGTDLILATVDGFGPISRLLPSARTDTNSIVSDKIFGAVQLASRSYKSNFGWQPFFYPRGGMVIFNIPLIEGTTAHQYVSNSTTGAWCRFKNMNANCWELCNDNAYFGGNGSVYLSDDGLDDDGSDIMTDVQTAFSYLKARGILKKFNMARPILTTDGIARVALEASVDFEDVVPSATPAFTPGTGGEWDTATWDVDGWSDSAQIQKNWQSINGLGYAVGMRMTTSSNGGNISWNTTDILWEKAAGML